MRCDDVPRLLTTGGTLGRWRARRHAVRCPRCAAFRSILDDLVTVPPLPDSHRALWARAAGEVETVRLARPRYVRPALVGLAAAAVLLIAVWLAWRPTPPRSVPEIGADRPTDVASATIRELDAMEGSLDPLTQELDDLRRRADLLDARRDVDRLLARYAWPERGEL
jgi:hypothetical protein